jgi:hypothetical protein
MRRGCAVAVALAWPLAACAPAIDPATAPVMPPPRGARATPPAPVPVPPVSEPAPAGWLKGQLHVHTANSPDSPTLPMDVVKRYTELGFDFIVITDHNYTTELIYDTAPLTVMIGAELTTNPDHCEPPPDDPEMRCRMHVNALFVPPDAPGEMPWPEENDALTDFTRIGLYRRHLDAVKKLGGVAMLNHPTWFWGVDGALLADLGTRGLLLVEIANLGFPAWNLGDETHPGAEAIWDAALTAGVTVWGVASDDAHHYYPDEIQARVDADKQPYPPGLAWVMVRAKNTPEAIRAAVVAGDFYSSTGVTLSRLDVAGGALTVAVAGKSPATFRFIGTGGEVLDEIRGSSARFELAKAAGGYVRAVVTDAAGRTAWTQPVRVN